jgi:putative endonuclease
MASEAKQSNAPLGRIHPRSRRSPKGWIASPRAEIETSLRLYHGEQTQRYLYCGVTSDLARRAFEHRTGAVKGFTCKYSCKLLVWYQPHLRMDEANTQEKQIKAGNRKNKLAMIESMNPDWADLYETLNQ